MKLWLKYSFGILFGALIYLVSPRSLLDPGGALAIAAEVATRIGYYIFDILLFTNLALAVLKLYEEKKFWKTGARALFFFLISTAAASVLGIIAALLVLPVRLPLLSETAAPNVERAGALLLSVFPENLLSIFLGSANVAVPLIVLSLSLGFAMAHDPVAARQVSNFFDSLSRLLHTMNVFITEIAAVLLIPISAVALRRLSLPLEGGLFAAFIPILLVASAALIGIFIPLALYFLGGRQNPFPLLYSSLPGALAAGISGNLRFASGTIIRESRENLGITRRYNSVLLPAGLLFGRTGTAFISAISFVIMLSSYSRLTISFGNILLIALIIPFATMLAASSFQAGPIAAITLASGFFGRGFESGFLVMVPITFLLSMMAGTIDALWIASAQAVADRRDVRMDRKDARHFI